MPLNQKLYTTQIYSIVSGNDKNTLEPPIQIAESA